MSVQRWIAASVWIAIFLAPLVLRDYQLTLLCYIGLSALVALGLAVLTGQAGLSSFGQAAYVGLGAYVTAILSLSYGFSPWATLPIVIALAIVGSYVGAQLTVSLNGHYLPLATIAFAEAAYSLFGALSVTGGQSGLANIPRLSLAGFELKLAWQQYLFIAVLCFVTMKAMQNLLDSRVGRALRAISSGSLMPEAMGVDTRAVKTLAFVVACTIAAIVGWFYAHFQQFINPTPFSLNQGIEYLFMVVLGGAGSLWGAFVGAGLVTLLKQYLQDVLPSILGFSGNFEIVVFAVLVIALFQKAPQGLIPGIRKRLGLNDIEPRMIGPAKPLEMRTKPAPGTLLLEARGVSKSFGGLIANSAIDMELHAGEIVSVIGPNGAGKSTFFGLLSGIVPLDQGAVTFLGRSTDGLSVRAVADLGLSRSFQHVKLVPNMSVIENVALGAHRRGVKGTLSAMLRLNRLEEQRILAEAKQQLERVGLGAYAWTPAGSLALGQQRILEIARALASDPLALLLDEPAAGLRHKEKLQLAETLASLRRDGLGILLVEHDIPFIMGLSDRVMVLEYGKKIAQGLPAEIRADSRVREAYLGAGA